MPGTGGSSHLGIDILGGMGKKDDRTLAIRQKANEARMREKKAEARRRALIQGGIILGVLVVVAAIVIAVVLGNRAAREVAIPENTATISVGETSDIPFQIAGTAVRVGSEEAPVTISLYEDFSCPHCKDYEAAVGQTLQELIAEGDVAVEYHPINVVSEYGIRAGSAAACVAAHEPESWTTAHASLFAVHDASTDAWNNEQFATFLNGQGIGGDELTECVESGRYANWIKQNTLEARDAGIASTPTLLINGERQEALLSPEQLRAAVGEIVS
ncbi:hypothetical protein FVA74_05265 [Salinibacterium sp. dk2585]|nr:hypothetical protein FVA74_05265 [Salinibacterium sp. dk2585]TXK52992.1 thioredoxin domain-containing protein [Salinibacterium sp. dk5596]